MHGHVICDVCAVCSVSSKIWAPRYSTIYKMTDALKHKSLYHSGNGTVTYPARGQGGYFMCQLLVFLENQSPWCLVPCCYSKEFISCALNVWTSKHGLKVVMESTSSVWYRKATAAILVARSLMISFLWNG